MYLNYDLSIFKVLLSFFKVSFIYVRVYLMIRKKSDTSRITSCNTNYFALQT